MEIKEALEIFETFRNARHQKLVNALLISAVRYSRLRVDWYLSTLEQRNELEEERTRAHNAFISNCDILSRNMVEAGEDNLWRSRIGAERKSIGDFACMINAVMGIKAR